MFGSKSKLSTEEINGLKNQLEQCDSVFKDMDAVSEIFRADMSEFGEATQRLEQDVNQTAANIDSNADFIQKNIETQASLIYELEGFVDKLKQLDAYQASIADNIRHHSEAAQQLVEANKHFTTPSKELSELPATLRANANKNKASLSKMRDCSKQMSVLSLNAAIEAGRLGDQGKDFVRSAEEIRNFTSLYNEAIEEIAARFEEQELWLAKTDEQIHHLISLLKDNNIATGKLMKQCDAIVANIDKTESPQLPETVGEIRSKIIGMRNAEEEILKAEERNRMQIGDITEELMSSRNTVEEMDKKVSPLFEKADNIRGIIEREDNEE